MKVGYKMIWKLRTIWITFEQHCHVGSEDPTPRKEKEDVDMEENIKTYSFDKDKPSGKGELKSNDTEKINE